MSESYSYDWRWTDDSRSDCLAYDGRWLFKRINYIPNPAKGRYSNGPEFTPPELMQRIANRGVTIPERIYCVVSNATTSGKEGNSAETRIVCNTGETGPLLQIRLANRLSVSIGRGDLVSVPVRDVRVAEGVMTVAKRPGRRQPKWIVHATKDSFRMDERRQGCPTVANLSAQVCPLTNAKSPANNVLEYCAGSAQTEILMAHVKRWHKSRKPALATPIISGLNILSEQVPKDVWVWMTLASYQAKADKKEQALASLTKAHKLSSNVKQQIQFSKMAAKWGSQPLADSARASACTLGLKSACTEKK